MSTDVPRTPVAWYVTTVVVRPGPAGSLYLSPPLWSRIIGLVLGAAGAGLCLWTAGLLPFLPPPPAGAGAGALAAVGGVLLLLVLGFSLYRKETLIDPGRRTLVVFHGFRWEAPRAIAFDDVAAVQLIRCPASAEDPDHYQVLLCLAPGGAQGERLALSNWQGEARHRALAATVAEALGKPLLDHTGTPPA